MSPLYPIDWTNSKYLICIDAYDSRNVAVCESNFAHSRSALAFIILAYANLWYYYIFKVNFLLNN